MEIIDIITSGNKIYVVQLSEILNFYNNIRGARKMNNPARNRAETARIKRAACYNKCIKPDSNTHYSNPTLYDTVAEKYSACMNKCYKEIPLTTYEENILKYYTNRKMNSPHYNIPYSDPVYNHYYDVPFTINDGGARTRKSKKTRKSRKNRRSTRR